MARRFLTLLFAFAAMVLGIEGLRRTVDWWRGDLAVPAPLDVMLMLSLPLLGWLWWRHVSPFGKGRGQCLDGACRTEDRKDCPPQAAGIGKPRPSSSTSQPRTTR